uniref:NAD-dependent epimerase/dehydratase domain-containing protein n=1 Tax=Tetradesmus obliquus TaxID=3088 RepID=A0A383VU92_TETOB|eukprot:jgi/Sobl393_1/11782/SZX69065.1
MARFANLAAPFLQQLTAGHAAAAVACSVLSGLRQYSHLALNNVRPGVVGGPGNRSSVSGGVATVFGATGFVGKYVVNELARRGTQVVVPYRSLEEKAMTLKQMGDLGQIVLLKGWHLNDDDMTRQAISRSNIVVNLIGSTLETRNFSFDDVHAAWPARLAAMAKETPKVERLLHFSDVGAAADHASARMRSKAVGDAAVRETFPDATIFKPAPIIGDEDDLLNNLLFQVKFNASVWMVDDGVQRFQPHHVTDVARAAAASLESHEAKGKDYCLGGPETITMRDYVSLIQECLHILEDTTMYVPAALAKAAYAPGDMLRRKLPPMPGRNYMYSGDYIDEISRDKVVPEGSLGYADLGILPMKVTEGFPIEAIRYQRTGGYSFGDSKALAKSLPASVKRYFGMQVPQ